MLNTLENLIKLARERRSSPVEGSYTNKLLTDKALSKAKVLEEVDELIEATTLQNTISERILEALEPHNTKPPIKAVVDTTVIEEKLESIWEILYDTKNGIDS